MTMLVSKSVCTLALGLALPLAAQEPGLRLFASLGPTGQTQLVDGQGQIVHTWPGGGTVPVYMQPDGSIARGTVDLSIGIPGTRLSARSGRRARTDRTAGKLPNDGKSMGNHARDTTMKSSWHHASLR